MPDDRHRHRWTGVEFYLADERPMMRQTCPRGAERRLPAFERYWDPSADREAVDPRMGLADPTAATHAPR